VAPGAGHWGGFVGAPCQAGWTPQARPRKDASIYAPSAAAPPPSLRPLGPPPQGIDLGQGERVIAALGSKNLSISAAWLPVYPLPACRGSHDGPCARHTFARPAQALP